jgi:ubiquinone/menaquinone biosynthesis C-methylase UbiE
MPDETYWNSLFDVDTIVKWLDLEGISDSVVEIGCGYGTFTVPVARTFSGIVHAFDIEAEMIRRTKQNVRRSRLRNVTFHGRDVVEKGTGLGTESIGMVLLFNILHSNEKKLLLREASRILKLNGRIAMIHWRKDMDTPRGPSVESRPDQREILYSARGLNLLFKGDSRILEPYHWGMQLQKGGDG